VGLIGRCEVKGECFVVKTRRDGSVPEVLIIERDEGTVVERKVLIVQVVSHAEERKKRQLLTTVTRQHIALNIGR
jgi:hypothetical protein